MARVGRKKKQSDKLVRCIHCGQHMLDFADVMMDHLAKKHNPHLFSQGMGVDEIRSNFKLTNLKDDLIDAVDRGEVFDAVVNAAASYTKDYEKAYDVAHEVVRNLFDKRGVE